MDRRAEFIRELQSSFDQNVFVMIRYGADPFYQRLENSLRQCLAEYGLTARLAKDCALSDDLWENVETYMKLCSLGIAVFEEVETREFNPNISLELGYMYALGRRCLLLKEKRMPRLPTDTCGRIYRDFDVLNLEATISTQVAAWCESDLGLVRLTTTAVASNDIDTGWRPIYDSTDDDFGAWTTYDTLFGKERHVRFIHDSAGGEVWRGVELSADASGLVGVNKKLQALYGRMIFVYRAVHSTAKVPNLYFCAIPMQHDDRTRTFVEVAAATVAESENANSPYRIRRYVPLNEIGDSQWHSGQLEFDFRNVPTAGYTVCAARINEGCPRPGEGILQIRRVRVLSPAPRS